MVSSKDLPLPMESEIKSSSKLSSSRLRALVVGGGSKERSFLTSGGDGLDTPNIEDRTLQKKNCKFMSNTDNKQCLTITQASSMFTYLVPKL